MHRWKRIKYGVGRDVPSIRADFEYENNLAQIRMEHGLTQTELGKEIGKSYSYIIKLEAGEIELFTHDRKNGYSIKPSILKLQDALDCSLSDIFPREICNIERTHYTNDQIIDLLYDGSRIKSESDIVSIVNKIISLLTKREAYIIRQIFFEDRSLQSIADEYNISRAAIGQIEQKVLRKLRQPSISNELRVYWEGDA